MFVGWNAVEGIGMLRLRTIFVFVTFVGGMLAGCAPETPPLFVPTATLQGAVVPTRFIPTQAAVVSTDVPTEIPTDIPTETLIPSETPTTTPSNTPTPATPVARAVRELMVRVGPGSQYPTLRLLEANEELAIIGISDDGSWYQVQLADGTVGWLVTAPTFIDTAGNIASVPIAAAPTETPTETPTYTPTASATPTETPTTTATATDTPSPTRTDTVTPTATETREANTIAFGDTLEGAIDNNTPSIPFTFEAAEGDILRIRLTSTSGDLDPTLVLLNPDGEVVARNDDESFSIKDAYLERTIEEDGLYTIVATRYREARGASVGNFTLSLQKVDASTMIQGIAYGETLTGTINDEAFEVNYNFEGAAGDVVNIDMTAASGRDLDAMLVLLGPDGEELAENDDYWLENRNSRIEYTLPEDGLYTIIATRYGRGTGDTIGSFTLSLMEGAVTPSTAVPSTASDNINDDQPIVIFTYTTTVSEVVTFDLTRTSGNLDPLLIITDIHGREIARNDDAGDGSSNSRISNLVLDQIGQYTIIATRFLQEDGETSGGFELSVNPGDPDTAASGNFSQPITYNDFLSGNIAADNQQAIYTFIGNEGDRITINVTATSGNLDTLLILTDSAGYKIDQNDDANTTTTNSTLANVELPYDGYYTIIIMPYEGTGNFEVSLTQE